MLYEAPPDIIYSLSLCSSFISIQATLPLTFIFTVLKSRAHSSVCRFRYEMSACHTWVEKVGTRQYKNIFGLMLLLTLIFCWQKQISCWSSWYWFYNNIWCCSTGSSQPNCYNSWVNGPSSPVKYNEQTRELTLTTLLRFQLIKYFILDQTCPRESWIFDGCRGLVLVTMTKSLVFSKSMFNFKYKAFLSGDYFSWCWSRSLCSELWSRARPRVGPGWSLSCWSWTLRK